MLPKDVSMEAIREVETLPRKYKAEPEGTDAGLSAQVKCTTMLFTFYFVLHGEWCRSERDVYI